jgi:hypothetical protein
VNRPASHACKPDLFHESIDSEPLLRPTQAGWKIEQKLTAAAGQEKLVVGVLKDKRWPEVLANQARLWPDQTADDSEQSAFAAAVAADKHP